MYRDSPGKPNLENLAIAIVIDKAFPSGIARKCKWWGTTIVPKNGVRYCHDDDLITPGGQLDYGIMFVKKTSDARVRAGMADPGASAKVAS